MVVLPAEEVSLALRLSVAVLLMVSRAAEVPGRGISGGGQPLLERVLALLAALPTITGGDTSEGKAAGIK